MRPRRPPAPVRSPCSLPLPWPYLPPLAAWDLAILVLDAQGTVPDGQGRCTVSSSGDAEVGVCVLTSGQPGRLLGPTKLLHMPLPFSPSSGQLHFIQCAGTFLICHFVRFGSESCCAWDYFLLGLLSASKSPRTWLPPHCLFPSPSAFKPIFSTPPRPLQQLGVGGKAQALGMGTCEPPVLPEAGAGAEAGPPSATHMFHHHSQTHPSLPPRALPLPMRLQPPATPTTTHRHCRSIPRRSFQLTTATKVCEGRAGWQPAVVGHWPLTFASLELAPACLSPLPPKRTCSPQASR